MADVALSVEVEGIEEVSMMFSTAGKKAENMHEPLQNSSSMMLKTFDMNFNSHGKELGEPWQRRKQGYPWPMLEKTGLMKESFDSVVTNDFVVLFNTVPYFKYHQSSAPRKRLPRRVMMKIDEERRRKIAKYFQQYLMGGN